MEIVMRRVDELIPYERNAKKHDAKQVANVANSIHEFEWQQPLVITEDNVVIIGHCRLLAAKKLGHKYVPCKVAKGLSDKQIRELRIADNKTNESEWDSEIVAIETEDLEFDGFDFDFQIDRLDGLTDADLEALMDKEVQDRAKHVHRVVCDCNNDEDAENAASILREHGYNPNVQNT